MNYQNHADQSGDRPDVYPGFYRDWRTPAILTFLLSPLLCGGLSVGLSFPSPAAAMASGSASQSGTQSAPGTPADTASVLPFMDDTAFRRNYWPFPVPAKPDSAKPDSAKPDSAREADHPHLVHPHLVLAVSGDYRGKLSPCGCPRLRMGGLPWRMDFIERLQKVAGNRIVQLDTGGTLVPPNLSPESSVIYLEYMLSALGRAGWEVINLTPAEARALDCFWQLPSVSGSVRAPVQAAAPPTGQATGQGATGQGTTGQGTGGAGRGPDTSPPSDSTLVWREWLPRTFHLMGDPPAALSGLWDIRHLPPPPWDAFPSDLPAGTPGSSPGGTDRFSPSGSPSGMVTLLSANLRHPRLPSHHLLRTTDGDYLVTGLTLFAPEAELSPLPAPWKIYSPEDGWARLVREVLPQVEHSRRLRGVVVLLWGDGSGAGELATRITSDLAARSNRLAPLFFHSSGAEIQSPRAVPPENTPLIPVGVEGRFMALAYALPSGFQVQSAIVTGQFRPPAVVSPSTGTVWDRVMETAFYLQSHLALQSLEKPLPVPATTGAGKAADGPTTVSGPGGSGPGGQGRTVTPQSGRKPSRGRSLRSAP